MAAKIDAVQLAGLLSYIAKAADVDTADSIAAHIAALEQDLLDMAQSHEETVKERDAAVADNAAVRLKLSQAADGYNSREFWDSVDALRGTAHPGAALLEEHRKALARARNQGREEAATSADDECSHWAEAEDTDDTGAVRRIRDALRDTSKRIRSKKEPE